MEFPSDQNSLFRYYDETLTLLPHDSLKRYNLQTIRNFIIHLDKVDSKTIAAETIFNYLTFIRTMDPITSNRQTVELYESFIEPKAPIYRRVGFIFYPGTELLILGTLLICAFIFFLGFSNFWYLLPLLCITIIVARISRKKRQNKLYGVKF